MKDQYHVQFLHFASELASLNIAIWPSNQLDIL